jgi:hypothetical protein
MTEIHEEIDGYTIIRGYDACPVDPEATKAAVAERIAENPALADTDLNELFETFAVYSANVGPGRKFISDDEYPACQALFDALGEYRCLTKDLVEITDFRNIEYWQKTDMRWTKQKISSIGEIVPTDAVLPDAMTEEQRAEISAQQESDRVAGLSGEQKAAELQARLDALADEADRLERRAHRQGRPFDSVAWYAEHKTPIEEKYA